MRKGDFMRHSTQIFDLGEKLNLDQFVKIVRFGAKVQFSPEYEQRVINSRCLIETAISENRIMYGVSTGFGVLSETVISSSEMEKLQENIVLSHAVSVGQPFSVEQARGTLLMVLQNLGQGKSGVRLELLETIRQMLNSGVTPYMPKEGSVGYLAPEAHAALVLLGKGQAYYREQLLPGAKAMEQAGIATLTLTAKEGLALISGTTSTTALGALALYDMEQAAKTADIIGAMSLEALRGVLAAFDERVMKARPHLHQGQTADNVRKILEGSGILSHFAGERLQDALSIRCIPQLHGAAKQTLAMAKQTIEIEMNSCCDNPMVFEEDGQPKIISACNCDSSYVGLAMDTAGIAATMLAKMSERRNNRFLDENLSGYPALLVKNPGLNSGLMLPQYTQAGLLGDMRILATPSVIDNTPTCCNQEDYVAAGYNSAKKAGKIAEKLQYILAIELLSAYQAQKFIAADLKRSDATQALIDEISNFVPQMEEDGLLHGYIEMLKDSIATGRIIEVVEKAIGLLH